jgi:hypothetical protein
MEKLTTIRVLRAVNEVNAVVEERPLQPCKVRLVSPVNDTKGVASTIILIWCNVRHVRPVNAGNSHISFAVMGTLKSKLVSEVITASGDRTTFLHPLRSK